MPGQNGETPLCAVVDTAVDGVILIDGRGTVLMFNPACERLFGYGRAADGGSEDVEVARLDHVTLGQLGINDQGFVGYSHHFIV